MNRWARTGLPALSLLALAGACGDDIADPLPQWRVSIFTDAQVPQFGDRLLVEVLYEDGTLACGGCRREFGVTSEDALPLSFGMRPPPSNRALLLRARLHRAVGTDSRGLPSGSALIDALGWLPSNPEGVREVSVQLSMGCFGKPAQLQAGESPQSCDPNTGHIGTAVLLADAEERMPQTGSWPDGRPIPCESVAPERMVCVPGGAFLLGSPNHLPTSDLFDPSPERLVVIHPFAMDIDETTVGEVRQLISSGAVAARPWINDGCTFRGVDDDTNDALPVNCVTHSLAEEVCATRGLRLATEAEWEWVAGNMQREDPYPWGTDTDVCAYAVLGRAALPTETELITGDTGCRPSPDGTTRPYGLQPAGHPKDVNVLGIRNLGGSVSEWLADDLVAYGDDCWSNDDVLIDPVCKLAVSTPFTLQAVRGSSWVLNRRVEVYYRDGAPGTGVSYTTGLRCAASMP